MQLRPDADRDRGVQPRPVRRGQPLRRRPALHADRGRDAGRGRDRAARPEQPQPDHPRRRQQPAEHRPDALPAGRPLGDATRCASATRSRASTGVMDFRFCELPDPAGRADRVQRTTNPRTPAPAPVGGNLKVASFNVLNFFNGDGLGGGFPTSRGANTQFEFDRQQAKEVSALTGDERRHRRADGDRERRAAEQRARGARRRAQRGDGRRHLRVHRHRRDRHRRDQGRAHLQAGGGDAGRRVQDHHDRVDPRFIDTLNRPSLAQTFQQNATGPEADGRRQPPEVEGLRLRRRRPRHGRRPGQLQPHAHERGRRRSSTGSRPTRPAAATPTSC